MKTISHINDLRAEIKKEKAKGNSIGLVPTMGFLHEGHLSLIRSAKKENDIVVVSIFVNPTQFNKKDDLDSYPRDLNRDSKLVEAEDADILFIPSVEEMYPNGYSTYLEVEGLITKQLCGKSREGHFKGVTTIVSKLFNMVTPHRAYFGQKDAQQVAVIEKMVRDMNMDIEIVPCPIVREADGLALSSRNALLKENERKEAIILSKSLFAAEKMIIDGERLASKIKSFITENIKTVKDAEIDYVEVVNGKTLENIHIVEGDVLIAVAVKMGKPRLIDNIRLEV
ncbi:pantoate--beta-alanine ligase [Anaeromicrobium sediminis]|uniref:Pantothenate synthetase n=1 Tax=Anaeromicrobium sediminis TaxID=1478221 RepID=A0A267MQD7_9FIRM|nr:pantoate--beta-alanine ligase [Anaeromicrobium sediminis]PAB61118.1 pantoate--beta-alanine ligase [Anaeromicrobium sediminis]